MMSRSSTNFQYKIYVYSKNILQNKKLSASGMPVADFVRRSVDIAILTVLPSPFRRHILPYSR